MEINGYPNYLIYEDGRVFSKKGKGKFLKPTYDSHGYMRVNLCNQGKLKTHKIHRLVALHYIDNPNKFPQVDHIDRNKSNNDISNLRFVDASTNCQNKDKYCTNTTGHKYISICNTSKRYVYRKRIRGISHSKRFKTLEEAIAYKESVNINKI